MLTFTARNLMAPDEFRNLGFDDSIVKSQDKTSLLNTKREADK